LSGAGFGGGFAHISPYITEVIFGEVSLFLESGVAQVGNDITFEDRTMRRRLILVLSTLLTIGVGVIAQTQESSKQLERKIVRQTIPRYPEIARRMNLTGTVKVVAVVAPDGRVTAVQPMGGSPVLIQAAQDAISQWKFAPAGSESRQVVELHFNPPAPQ